MSPAAPTSHSALAIPVTRALLGIAFLATLAAAVVSWFAGATLALDLRPVDATALAERGETILRLQQANLALILAALSLIVTALVLHLRRAAKPARWITICAWTRRVEWQGRWISFEEFLAQRFDVRCTHGICEEEAAKLRAADIAPEKS